MSKGYGATTRHDSEPERREHDRPQLAVPAMALLSVEHHELSAEGSRGEPDHVMDRAPAGLTRVLIDDQHQRQALPGSALGSIRRTHAEYPGKIRHSHARSHAPPWPPMRHGPPGTRTDAPLLIPESGDNSQPGRWPRSVLDQRCRRSGPDDPMTLASLLSHHPLPGRGAVRAPDARQRWRADRAAGALGHRGRRLAGRDARDPRRVRGRGYPTCGRAPAGSRRPQVGGGVIDAFYAGYETIDPSQLRVPLQARPRSRPAARLLRRADGPDGGEPRIGTCSGKPYFFPPGRAGAALPVPAEATAGSSRRAAATRTRSAPPSSTGGAASSRSAASSARSCGTASTAIAAGSSAGSRCRGTIPSSGSCICGRWARATGAGGRGASGTASGSTSWERRRCTWSRARAYRMTRPPLVIGGLAMLYGYFRSMLARAAALRGRRVPALPAPVPAELPAHGEGPRHRGARRATGVALEPRGRLRPGGSGRVTGG